MGKTKKTRKFAVAKKMISPKDTRVKENLEKAKKKEAQKQKKEEPKQVEQAVSALFFQYNTQLGPPYHVLIDTNFINFSIRKKLDMGKYCCRAICDFCYMCMLNCPFLKCINSASSSSLSQIRKSTHIFFYSTVNDGLSTCEMYTMCNGLCYG